MPGNDKPPKDGNAAAPAPAAPQGGKTSPTAMSIRTSGRAKTVRIRSGERTSVWNNVDVELDPQTGIVQLSRDGKVEATTHISAALVFWETEPPTP